MCGGLRRWKDTWQGNNSDPITLHIRKRHIPGGDAPHKQGDLFAPGTSVEQLERAARDIVTKGKRKSIVDRPIHLKEKWSLMERKQTTGLL